MPLPPFCSVWQSKEDWLGREDEPLTGFSWRGGSEPETTGIQLWSEVFVVRKGNGKEVQYIQINTIVNNTHRAIRACLEIQIFSRLTVTMIEQSEFL